MKGDTVAVRFTKKELWELMNGFDASFITGPENKLATRVSNKLHKAYEAFDRETGQ